MFVALTAKNVRFIMKIVFYSIKVQTISNTDRRTNECYRNPHNFWARNPKNDVGMVGFGLWFGVRGARINCCHVSLPLNRCVLYVLSVLESLADNHIYCVFFPHNPLIPHKLYDGW